jgi:hypothetical protein
MAKKAAKAKPAAKGKAKSKTNKPEAVSTGVPSKVRQAKAEAGITANAVMSPSRTARQAAVARATDTLASLAEAGTRNPVLKLALQAPQIIKQREYFFDPVDYGAIGDGLDSSQSKNAKAFADMHAAIGSNGGTVLVPAGHFHTDGPFANSVNKMGIRYEGQGSANGSVGAAVTSIIFTAGSGSLISLDGTEAMKFEHFKFGYSNPAFTGPLINLRQRGGGSVTSFTVFRDFYMAGTTSAKGAVLIDAGKTLKTFLANGYIQLGKHAIVGAISTTDFCNGMYVDDVWFDRGMVTAMVAGGINWIFDNCIWEPPSLTSEDAGAVLISPYGINNLGFRNGQFSDAGSAGAWLNCERASDYGPPGVAGAVSFAGNLIQGGTVSLNVKNIKGLELRANYFAINRSDGCVLNASMASAVTAGANRFATSAGPDRGVLFIDAPTDAASNFDNNDGRGMRSGKTPITDPHVAGQVWNDMGVLKASAG